MLNIMYFKTGVTVKLSYSLKMCPKKNKAMKTISLSTGPDFIPRKKSQFLLR